VKRNLCSVLIVLFFILSLACVSCSTNTVVGSGNVITQTFDVSNFDQVNLAAFGEVFIEQGETESLSIETDDNIMPLLDIKVRDGELVLGMEPNKIAIPSGTLIYRVTVKELGKITIAGSGNFAVEPVQSNDMTLSLQGSGNINLKGLTANTLSIDLNGSGNITVEGIKVKAVDTSNKVSGDIKLEGQANTQKFTLGGSGNYLAGDLQTDSADISITGSGNVTLWATNQLKITVSGSGDVKYYGKPTVDQSGSGSGNIISLGDK